MLLIIPVSSRACERRFSQLKRMESIRGGRTQEAMVNISFRLYESQFCQEKSPYKKAAGLYNELSFPGQPRKS